MNKLKQEIERLLATLPQDACSYDPYRDALYAEAARCVAKACEFAAEASKNKKQPPHCR